MNPQTAQPNPKENEKTVLMNAVIAKLSPMEPEREAELRNTVLWPMTTRELRLLCAAIENRIQTSKSS